MPFGAALQPDGLTRFRLWAPSAQTVDLCIAGAGVPPIPMVRTEGGWFEVRHIATAGTRYRLRIAGALLVPGPASRFNPDDVHGAGEVLDPEAYTWEDSDWRGRPWEEAVIHELHVGTFSPEGTFRGVEERLDYLKALGVTAVELMPVADFSGSRNWGYDGVLPFAPDAAYGRPEDLKRLAQEAHQRNSMVLLWDSRGPGAAIEPARCPPRRALWFLDP